MNSSNCEMLKTLMVEVLYDEASPGDRERLDEHLTGCVACREEMADLRRVRAELQRARPEDAPAPVPRVLVLGRPRASAWARYGGMAAAAALVAVAALAIFRADVGIGADGFRISFGQHVEQTAADTEDLRAEILGALEAYRQEDLEERDLMVASFREELRQRDTRRQREADALANVLMASWNETRQDDLRFVLDRLGYLEQRTGRTQELLQHAVLREPAAGH